VHIIRLLKTTSPEALKQVLYVTCLAGLANAVLLGLINAVAGAVATRQHVGVRMLLLYGIAVAIFFTANRASLRRANTLLQGALADLRLRLADKIRRSQLRALERVGRGEIYATVGQETNYLSQNFPLLLTGAQSMFLVSFCLLYIGWLSLVSFIVIVVFGAAGLWFFRLRHLALRRDMGAVHASETELLEALTHFAEGFQEIRLNADKNDGLYRRFLQIVDDLESVIVGIGGKWVVLLLFGNAFLYALLGVGIFVLPGFFEGYTDII
jgi:putative ATP-binding cassette transporter